MTWERETGGGNARGFKIRFVAKIRLKRKQSPSPPVSKVFKSGGALRKKYLGSKQHNFRES
jgi:hypothetical protein